MPVALARCDATGSSIERGTEGRAARCTIASHPCATAWSRLVSRMLPCTNSTARPARLSALPVDRSSNATTWPSRSSSSSRHRFAPMNPAPPVTSTCTPRRYRAPRPDGEHSLVLRCTPSGAFTELRVRAGYRFEDMVPFIRRQLAPLRRAVKRVADRTLAEPSRRGAYRYHLLELDPVPRATLDELGDNSQDGQDLLLDSLVPPGSRRPLRRSRRVRRRDLQ